MGEDNGLNAWLDMQSGQHDLTSQEQELVKYAKVNSDKNRCFDIDDVPIKGPHTELNRHPLLVSNFSPDIAKELEI